MLEAAAEDLGVDLILTPVGQKIVELGVKLEGEIEAIDKFIDVMADLILLFTNGGER